MRIEETEFIARDGRKITIRSIDETEAQKVIDFMITENTQTYFMANYPEEIQNRGIEKEAEWLKGQNQSDRDFFIGAFDGEKLIGSCGVACIAPKIKMRHRAGFGIGFLEEYTGLGLGSFLTSLCIKQAKANGFEQLELDVFEDNMRALHVYQKAGFKITGVHPRAFKLKDGSYHDAVDMTYILR